MLGGCWALHAKTNNDNYKKNINEQKIKKQVWQSKSLKELCQILKDAQQ